MTAEPRQMGWYHVHGEPDPHRLLLWPGWVESLCGRSFQQGLVLERMAEPASMHDLCTGCLNASLKRSGSAE